MGYVFDLTLKSKIILGVQSEFKSSALSTLQHVSFGTCFHIRDLSNISERIFQYNVVPNNCQSKTTFK